MQIQSESPFHASQVLSVRCLSDPRCAGRSPPSASSVCHQLPEISCPQHLESNHFSPERWQWWVAHTGLALPGVQTEASSPCPSPPVASHTTSHGKGGVWRRQPPPCTRPLSVTLRPKVRTPAVGSSHKGTGLRKRPPQPWNRALGRKNWGRGPGRQVPWAHRLFPLIGRGADREGKCRALETAKPRAAAKDDPGPSSPLTSPANLFSSRQPKGSFKNQSDHVTHPCFKSFNGSRLLSG